MQKPLGLADRPATKADTGQTGQQREQHRAGLWDDDLKIVNGQPGVVASIIRICKANIQALAVEPIEAGDRRHFG